MGERTDDLAPRNNEFLTRYERDQEIAGRNQELMREQLSSTPPVPGEVPEATSARGADYVVESTAAPDESRRDQSTAEIRENIEDTRARMGSTIDAIQEKLSPQNLMQQAKDTAREATIGKAQEMASNVADTAKETSSTLMDTIRQNPVPVALTAIGLGWLLIGARREASNRRDRDYRYGQYGSRYRAGYPGPYERPLQQPQQQGSGRMSQMADQAQEVAGKITDQVQGTASNVGEHMQEAAGNVADKAGDMADYAQWQAQRTRGWLQQTWEDSPLLMVGGAFALGTIVGLAIPETKMENQLMGETRDTLVQKAQGVAQDTVQKVQSAATNVTDQVKQQAQQQQSQTRSGQGSETTH